VSLEDPLRSERRMMRIAGACALVGTLLTLWSGRAYGDGASVAAVRAPAPIVLDGKLDEPAWRDAGGGPR
jgi:hypothetical protein